MDGYSSFVSHLIVGNLKITFEVTTPQAIIADINILKEAPLSMLWVLNIIFLIAGSNFKPDLIFPSLKEIKILLDEIY